MGKSNKMTLYIDLDDTIRGKEGLVVLDAQPTLLKFKRQGHKIIIFTARAAHPDLIGPIHDWLTANKIPYDGVTNIKGAADYYIDDKAIKFTTWAEVQHEI